MIKLVAIDLDGTLLNEDMEISQKNLNAITKLRENNVKVVIATGRPHLFIKQFVKQLDLDTPYIMYNGGLVEDLRSNKILSNTLLSHDILVSTLDLLEETNTPYMLYGKQEIFYKECNRVNYLKQVSMNIEEQYRATFTLIEDYEKIANNNQFNKVLVIEEDPIKNMQIYDKLKSLEKDFDIIRSSSMYIEVIPKGVSKKSGIEVLSKYYDISPNEIMALGDQENDFEMITYVKYGIAMGNGIDKIKEQAYDITLKNTEDGVSYAIDKHILSKL